LTLVTRELERLPLPAADRDRIIGQLERVGQLVERELKRARFAGEGAGQRFDPAQDIPTWPRPSAGCTGARRPGRDRSAGCRRLPFDREDILELLGNLLDNACKWARERVIIEMIRDGDVVFRVCDDGPGIAVDDRERLLRRGVRLDEQEPGHGLGLAIVRELVEGYGAA
jgi:signal transduction histidine kinase